MKPYTTEVEFLRDEVEKCHASMHSQIETISLLMKKNIALKEQNRKWVGLTDEEIDQAAEQSDNYASFIAGVLFAQDKLEEKNGG
jgi:hypothetical protein